MPFRRTSIDSNQRTGFYSPKRSRVAGGGVYSFDPDALQYINAVEAADNQALAFPIKVAYNEFILGCKADAIWSDIKSSCILVGASTLSGALVPLVGVAPSGFNISSSQYSANTGLRGDGASSAYLDSNRPNNSEAQNDKHISVYITNPPLNAGAVTGGRALSAQGYSTMDKISKGAISRFRINYATGGTENRVETGTSTYGFMGMSRSSSSDLLTRIDDENRTLSQTSSAPTSTDSQIFFARRNLTTGAPENFSSFGLAFYSIGEATDLVLLDNRVSRLINSIRFYLYTGYTGESYDVDTLKYINIGYAAGGTLG